MDGTLQGLRQGRSDEHKRKNRRLSTNGLERVAGAVLAILKIGHTSQKHSASGRIALERVDRIMSGSEEVV